MMKMRWATMGAIGVMLATAACNKAAPSGQTVARVDGEEITRPELDAEFQALRIPPSERGKARADVLKQIIDRKLFAKAAQEAKIDQAPGFIMMKRRADEIMLATAYAQQIARKGEGDPTESQINQYLAARPLLGAQRALLTLDQARYPTTNAAAVAATKDVMSMDALVGALQGAGVAVQRGSVTVDSASIPDEFAAPMLRLKPGEPLIISQGNAAIAFSIVDRKPVPSGGQDSVRVAAAKIKQAAGAAAFDRDAKAMRAQAKIDYADGYGPGSKPAEERAASAPNAAKPAPDATKPVF